MDGYFKSGIGFLDGYFLNELVPWTGDGKRLCEKPTLVWTGLILVDTT